MLRAGARNTQREHSHRPRQPYARHWPPAAGIRQPRPPAHFVVLVYRMPGKPTAGRVAVWRQLKKIGAISLQQSVCVFPDKQEVRRELADIVRRVADAGGEWHLLPLRPPNPAERRKLIAQFREQTARHYLEIIENCEVNFQKEIEFEVYRKNFTYVEAEEIRIEFEKIVEWFERVLVRDWFGAPNQQEARDWLERCHRQVHEFEATVYETEQTGPFGDGGIGRRAPRRRQPPHLTRPARLAARGS
jgi:hypothetical protein